MKSETAVTPWLTGVLSEAAACADTGTASNGARKAFHERSAILSHSTPGSRLVLISTTSTRSLSKPSAHGFPSCFERLNEEPCCDEQDHR